MRLRTIWTTPAMTITERLRRTRDWAALTTAEKLPLRVRYWATLMELGKATTTGQDLPATPLGEILQNLRTPKDHPPTCPAADYLGTTKGTTDR